MADRSAEEEEEDDAESVDEGSPSSASSPLCSSLPAAADRRACAADAPAPAPAVADDHILLDPEAARRLPSLSG